MSEEKEQENTEIAVALNGSVVLKLTNLSILVNYLQVHELDIAWNENDYGDLYGLFVDIIGHPPNSKESCVI